MGGHLGPINLFHCEHRVYLLLLAGCNPAYTTDGLFLVSSPKLGKYRPKNEVFFLLDSFLAPVPLMAAISPMS